MNSDKTYMWLSIISSIALIGAIALAVLLRNEYAPNDLQEPVSNPFHSAS